MDLAFSAEDLKFRDEVRDWIAKNLDAETKAMQAQSKNGYLDKDAIVRWQKKLYERGWIAPDWPVEHGGAGFTPTQRYIFNMEMAAAGTPTLSPMGLKMVAPVIMK